MKARARGSRLEVEDPGEPHLDPEAAGVAQPPPEDELGQPLEEAAEPGPTWDADKVEKTLMGLWNFQVLYYGIAYAAQPGELRPAAEQLVPVFEAYVPPEMEGVIGNVAGAGLVAGTAVQMWQEPRRVAARQAPQGPLAALLGRRKRAAAAQPAAEAPGADAAVPEPPPAAAPPQGPAGAAEEGGGGRFAPFTREQMAAIRAAGGAGIDQPLEAYGLPDVA